MGWILMGWRWMVIESDRDADGDSPTRQLLSDFTPNHLSTPTCRAAKYWPGMSMEHLVHTTTNRSQ